MKRLAVCPSCGRRVSRARSLETKAIRCAGCGVLIKSRALRRLVTLLGACMFVLLSVQCIAIPFDARTEYRYSALIDWAFMGCMVVVFGLVWLAIPYVVWFGAVSHGPVCRQCGYELRGCAGPDCPECGTRIDVPIGRDDDAAES